MKENNFKLIKNLEAKSQSSKSSSTNNNFKITYSGDCRPTEDLVVHGNKSDVLIHECTFDNSFYRNIKIIKDIDRLHDFEYYKRTGMRRTKS